MSDFPEFPKYIYLTDFREIEGGKLCVAVTEGIVEDKEELIDPPLNFAGRAIVCTEKSRKFVFLWDSYFAFSVRDESFVLPEDGEPRGVFVEHSSSSAFLQYLLENAVAVPERITKPLRHWHIACLDHVVDVVSVDVPIVR
jgi:hypothetical protein